MRIHHLEIACKCLQQRIQAFTSSFGVFLLCQHAKESSALFRLGPIYLVLTENPTLDRDSVENIAFEVDDISHICQNVRSTLGEDYILSNPSLVDKNCYSPEDNILTAVVKSPIGNVKHTLLTKNGCTKYSLPGFPFFHFDSTYPRPQVESTKASKNTLHNNEHITGIDHITFAVPQSSSFSFIDWYQKCFGFSRLLVNNEERDTGFIVKTQNNKGNSLGLRLTALQEHLCSELALHMTGSSSDDPIKFVFAESLPGQGPNQIDSFLKEHEGPGIQHIGLLTSDICHAALQWKKQGVNFLTPPTHYYQEVKRTLSMLPTEINTKMIQEHGILVDHEGELVDSSSSFLLQVFTKPIFEQNTFFFELIQRHGAMGFGAGNIAALWRAVDTYFREKEIENLQAN